MASEKTPLVGRAIQERPAKRFCHGSPTLTSGSLPDAVDLLIKDDHLPAHLKTILGHLLDNSNRINELLARNRKFLYEYSIQVHPEHEDEDLAGLLHPDSRVEMSSSGGSSYGSSYTSSRRNQQTSGSSVKRSYHSDLDCTYMVNVRFVLFHRNINGKAQSTTKAEFSSHVTLRTVIEHFRLETSCDHHGVFAPRLAYSVGRDHQTTYPLTDTDLDRPLSDLLKDNDDVNSLSILADIC